MPPALKVDWNEIRKASELGMTDKEISEEYGVLQESIRKRRFDSKKKGQPWLTGKELKMRAAIEHAKREAEAKVRESMRLSTPDGASRSVDGLAIDAKSGELSLDTKPAEVALAEKLLRGGELVSDMAMDIILQKLGYARANPESIAKLESIQDVAAALGAGRKAAGMDKAQAPITLAFASYAPVKGASQFEKVVDV